MPRDSPFRFANLRQIVKPNSDAYQRSKHQQTAIGHRWFSSFRRSRRLPERGSGGRVRFCGAGALAAQPRGTYRVEIGYYQPMDMWRSIATSDKVIMPAESASEKVDVDVATVPFHLSFQLIVDMFRTSSGGTLTESISQLQERASDEQESLTAEEREILRAMNLSLSDLAAARRAYLDSDNRETVRKRLEAILGFGASSPAGGFGGSSRS